MVSKKDKKTKPKKNKIKKEMKKFAKFLSGKDVEFQIKDNTISMYVEGDFLCGFTGKIMAEDYRKEKKALDKREKKLDESEKKLALDKEFYNVKRITKLNKLLEIETERKELMNDLLDS